MPRITAHRVWPVLLAFATVTGLARGNDADQATKVEFFEKKIRPILANHCHACHSADTNAKGGLRIDDRNGLLAGGNLGPAVVPGDAAKSLQLQRVTHKDVKRRMPLESAAMTDEQIADLTRWVKDGAAWPALFIPASLGKPKAEYQKLKKEHWAWQPLTEPKIPAVKDTQWPKDDVDRFLLARLEAQQLHPVGDADRLALIRRVTFDLIGLPPTPAEIDAFLTDFVGRRLCQGG